MIRIGPVTRTRAPWMIVAAVVVGAVWPAPAAADEIRPAGRVAVTFLAPGPEASTAPTVLADLDYRAIAAELDTAALERQQDQSGEPVKKRSVTRRILGGAAGGVGGFFGGGYLGAAIEGDCDCDDPGLMGALIGAPIGAAVGAIVGALFF